MMAKSQSTSKTAVKETPKAPTVLTSIPFTAADLMKLHKIGCAIDMCLCVANNADSSDEVSLPTAIELTKDVFWPVYWDLHHRLDEATGAE